MKKRKNVFILLSQLKNMPIYSFFKTADLRDKAKTNVIEVKYEFLFSFVPDTVGKRNVKSENICCIISRCY